MIVELVIFIVISISLVILSWKSFWNLRVHGIYRFITFELILAVIFLNTRSWFDNPFSIAQIISWILLAGSIIMAVQGFYLLHGAGKPAKGIEDTTKLVKAGLYKYIRHPLYSSLIMMGWGVFLKGISLVPLILAILATLFAVITAIIEEKENLKRFGRPYAAYMKSTKRFIPFLV
jgi:protein-S-isoprenylcysteine O-methyltransferase Ste14